MYSQFEGEESQRTGKMHFLKGIAIGFGAGLFFATVATMIVLPDTSAAEPSSLMAVPFSATARGSSARLRGDNPIVRSWNTRDGHGHARMGGTAVLEKPSPGGYSQPSYQQHTSAQAQVPAGQYSPEQLEFLRRAGKMPSQPVQMDDELKISMSPQGNRAVVCKGETSCIEIELGQNNDRKHYSPEQLEFLRRTGKLPTMNEPHLDFMRRKMQDQYQRPTMSWDSPTSEAAAGRRDGYRPYHKQRFT
eukprot:gnl/TRDRNA2_/TRDRNA2_48808_c0_seq1.p1 gnl/TRDRNA2_/TRDRNA2_48808_c0~~gnl/TRDRNA2_/TRDRNA2_48808_c0_seq1.p1  ORF type:complete len:247 (+),score=29.70 gnl/TRDRNA2_/TRDRNA2_48808_c0_seq1:99-839(+)